MKNIIAATALSLMMGTAALAQTTAFSTYQTDVANDIYASELIGMRIYSAETDYDTFAMDSTVAEGAEREWDDIGEVNDVVLGRDGSVRAVIIGVGGFIGIGEKDVALPMSAIKMVREADADDADDFFLVVNASKDALTNAEEFKDAEDLMDERKMDAAKVNMEDKAMKTKDAVTTTPNDAAVAVENTADTAAAKMDKAADDTVVVVKDAADTTADAASNVGNAVKTTAAAGAAAVTTAASDAANAAKGTMEKMGDAQVKTTEQTVAVTTTEPRMDGDRTMLRTPMFEREGYTPLATEELTTENLTGARVYGLNDEDIGEIDELVVDDSGKISKAVLGIGGFLGIGEHSVAVTMDEMKIVRTDDADDVRVYIDATKEELEAQPAYTR